MIIICFCKKAELEISPAFLFIEANPTMEKVPDFTPEAFHTILYGKMDLETLFIPSLWSGSNGLLTWDIKSINIVKNEKPLISQRQHACYRY